jgi:polyhydroxyalkanoate synthesis regulator phasin
MAQNEIVKRYLDAGANFTELTQRRAEAIVKDLVKTGEVQAEQAQQAVQDLLDRSRRSTERFLELVRHEVRAQVAGLGLASKKELARLEKRIDVLRPKPAAKNSPAKKTTAKKTTAKKTTAKKTTAKKTTAKKTTAKKAPAKKTTAKKAPAKKTAARKTAAKKAPAKKSAGR